MHPRMLHEVVERCRQRAAQGDCPTAEPFSIEILETAIIELAKPREPRTFPMLVSAETLARQIANDPDRECEAGRDLPGPPQGAGK